MRWKTALHSVSYAGVWPGQCRLSLEAFLDKARALGFDAVMLMAKRPHLSVLEYDQAARARLRAVLRELSLEVACLAGYTDFCMGREHPEVPAVEMQIEHVTQLASLAHDLDCRLVRVFTGYAHEGTAPELAWNLCVEALRECARRAARYGVTLGVQNHHDTAAHYESLFDLLTEIDEPNCRAMFDAWSLALHGSDLEAAVRKMAPFIVHTTVADYVRRPRFRYEPQLVNYTRLSDAIRAVPMGSGFIDYPTFFRALAEVGYAGYVAYEMCSPLHGGGAEYNLDQCARRFLESMRTP
jgi:sugar phosphate isomerase/epimerase